MRYIKTYSRHLNHSKRVYENFDVNVIRELYKQLFIEIIDKAQSHGFSTNVYIIKSMKDFIIDINQAYVNSISLSDLEEFAIKTYGDKYPSLRTRLSWNDISPENSWLKISVYIDEDYIESEELGLL